MTRPTCAFAVAVALGVTAGCEDTVTYSYINIDVKFDRMTIPPELIDQIEGCAVFADTPVRRDQDDLRCRRHMVPYEYGKFQYTTTLTSGAIKFTVRAVDFNQVIIAAGEVGPLTIKRGGSVDDSILVKAVPQETPDAGTGPEAGPRDATTPDAATPDAAAPDTAAPDAAGPDAATDAGITG